MRLWVTGIILANLSSSNISPTSAVAQEYCLELMGSTPTRSVIATDVDGDGDLDLVATRLGIGITVRKNNGSGQFSAPVDYAVGDGGSNEIASADLDGDGDQDLAVMPWGGGDVFVLKNLGNGVFAIPIDYVVGQYAFSLFASDLDGDGDQDLVTGNFDSDDVSVLKNNGSGTFAPADHYSVGLGYTYTVYAADVDGDQDKDLIVGAGDTIAWEGVIAIMKNNGNATFVAPTFYPDGHGLVIAADLDGDGDQDIACAGGEVGEVSILKNYGDGTFTITVNYVTGSWPRYICSADLDGDGDQDLAVPNQDGNVAVLRNEGDGTFAPEVNYSLGSAVGWGTYPADLDSDGDMDLAIGTLDGISILKNIISPWTWTFELTTASYYLGFDWVLEALPGHQIIALGDCMCLPSDCGPCVVTGTIPPATQTILARFETFPAIRQLITLVAAEYIDGRWVLNNLRPWLALKIGCGDPPAAMSLLSNMAPSPLVVPVIADTSDSNPETHILINLAEWFDSSPTLSESYDFVDGVCPALPGFLAGTADFEFDSLAAPSESPFTTIPLSATLYAVGYSAPSPTSYSCLCLCHQDPVCDSTTNVFDVVEAVDVAFRAGEPGGSTACPKEPTDVDCDGVTNVFDVVKFVDVAFRAADPAVAFCDPCPN